MDNFLARTEIHEARTNIALAESHLEQDREAEAGDVLLDAEKHYRIACTAVTMQRADSVQEKLTDLRRNLDRLRYAIKIKSNARHVKSSANG